MLHLVFAPAFLSRYSFIFHWFCRFYAMALELVYLSVRLHFFWRFDILNYHFAFFIIIFDCFLLDIWLPFVRIFTEPMVSQSLTVEIWATISCNAEFP